MEEHEPGRLTLLLHNPRQSDQQVARRVLVVVVGGRAMHISFRCEVPNATALSRPRCLPW